MLCMFIRIKDETTFNYLYSFHIKKKWERMGERHKIILDPLNLEDFMDLFSSVFL